MDPIRILVPTGSLGSGVSADEVAYGLAQGARAIATDAGSTDSGAAYLATGTSKNDHSAVKRDLRILMLAAAKAGVPLLVGSSGQAGGDRNLDWTFAIAAEVAREEGLHPRVALLYSEQSRETVKTLNAAGRIRPLEPAGALRDETIDACEHIVAVMGLEPYLEALRHGAEVILGGRTTDTAVLAAYATLHGAGKAAAWHAGKIAECGALCAATRDGGSGVLISIDEQGFEVEPLSPTSHCTPASVAAHMLYENSDPFRLVEPGGILDVEDAVYAQHGERAVRVTGARWKDMPYTMKLEGAGARSYQTVMLVGIQDPKVLARVDEFHDKLLDALYRRTRATLGEQAGEFHISLRMYGWNAVSGDHPPAGTAPPRELGMLFVATAATQRMATRIAKACNPYFFHYPIDRDQELPSYAFPFSPAEMERGPVYTFELNHVVEIDDPLELVRIRYVDLPKEGAL